MPLPLLFFLQMPNAALSATQVATALAVLVFVLLWIVSSASNLEKVIAWFTAGRRQREAALSERLSALEAASAQIMDIEALRERFEAAESKHKLLAAEVMNQHNTLHEYERTRVELKGEFRASIETLREKVHGLETMPGRVDKMESKLDNLTLQINDIKQGQRDLKAEIREDMRSNKSEILQAIKNIKE